MHASGDGPVFPDNKADADLPTSDVPLGDVSPSDSVRVTVVDPLHSGSMVVSGLLSCANAPGTGDENQCWFAAGTLEARPATGVGVTWEGACASAGDGTTCTVTGGTAVTVTFWPTGSSVWWVATKGDDGNSGHTPKTAFKTFHKALTTMASGDALYIIDGTYNQSIGGYQGAYSTWDTSICKTLRGAAPCASSGSSERNEGPNGIDSSHRTRILGFRRDKDHRVIIDGTKANGGNGVGLQLFRAAHVEVGYITSRHTAAIDPVEIEQSDDIYVHHVAGAYPDLNGSSDNNRAIFYIGDCSNVLVEESWAWGYGGRYGFVAHGGKNNIFRRNVARYDGSPNGEMRAGVAIYSEDNTIAENNIVLDFDPGPDDTDDGHAPYFLPCSVPLSSPSLSFGLGTVSLYGNIAVNTIGDTEAYIQIDSFCSTGGTITLENNVVAGAGGTTVAGIWLEADDESHHKAAIRHNTIYNAKGRGVRIDSSPNWPTVTFQDNLIAGASQECLQDLGSGARTIGYNQSYACSGKIAGDSHLLTTDPSLSYLLRVDSGGGKGTASDGGDRGATVIKKYLKGTLTDVDLWPFPNEDMIRADFCAKPDGGSINTRKHNESGWCASEKSLTKYLWEQLGRPSPY